MSYVLLDNKIINSIVLLYSYTIWPDGPYPSFNAPVYSEFLGGKTIKSFHDFTTSKSDGVVTVIGCYLGVEEGVDMWIDRCSNKPQARFRLRVNAGDYENKALFLLTDDMVRKVAPLTCKLLLDTKQGSSIYPLEIDSMFGDPLILEVDSKFTNYINGEMSYDVLRVFTHSSLLDVFLHLADYLPSYDAKDYLHGHLLGESPSSPDLVVEPHLPMDGETIHPKTDDLVICKCNNKASGLKRKWIERASDIFEEELFNRDKVARTRSG